MTISRFPLARSLIGFVPMGCRKAFLNPTGVSRFFFSPCIGQNETDHEEGKCKVVSVLPYQRSSGMQIPLSPFLISLPLLTTDQPAFPLYGTVEERECRDEFRLTS